jgi:hypothetical protein
VKVAVFSDGTATLQNQRGGKYPGEIVSQRVQALEQTGRRVDSSPLPNTQVLWKLVQEPSMHAKFTIRDQWVYGEVELPEDGRRRGDFFTIDVIKLDNQWVGTSRFRWSQAKTCEWTFEVRLTSVTADRIEGLFGGFGNIDPKTCANSGGVGMNQMTWIRE